MIWDKMILLHTYVGILYKLLGFPLFLYLLCSWGVLSLSLLMLAAYLIGKHYLGSEEVGFLSALLVGWNWQLGWYGHRILNDVALGALMVLTFALASMYFEKQSAKAAALVGASLALTLWAKESSLYLIPPLIAWLLVAAHKNPPELEEVAAFAISFLLVFIPFAAICYLRYGHPIYPIIARLHWYGILEGRGIPLYLNINIAAWLPFALGATLIPFLFTAYGFISLCRERFLFLPGWALHCYIVHIFLVPALPHCDQHVVHYTPLFLIAAAYGLWKAFEKLPHHSSPAAYLRLLLVVLVLVSTNLYIPSASLLGKAEIEVVPLHIKIANNKLEKIDALVSSVGVSSADWLSEVEPAQCFYRPTTKAGTAQ